MTPSSSEQAFQSWWKSNFDSPSSLLVPIEAQVVWKAACTWQRTRDAELLENQAAGFDYIPERVSCEPEYDAPSFASGYKMGCRVIAKTIRAHKKG